MDYNQCFNPCFNGYSTLTEEDDDLFFEDYEGFNPCFNGYSTLTIIDNTNLLSPGYMVSILVLMDTLL